MSVPGVREMVHGAPTARRQVRKLEHQMESVVRGTRQGANHLPRKGMAWRDPRADAGATETLWLWRRAPMGARAARAGGGAQEAGSICTYIQLHMRSDPTPDTGHAARTLAPGRATGMYEIDDTCITDDTWR